MLQTVLRNWQRRNNVPSIFYAIYWMKRMLLWQISVGFYVGIVILRRVLEGSCREAFDTQFRREWGKHKKFDSTEGFDFSASWVEVRRLITWSFWWVRRLLTQSIVKSYWLLFWLNTKQNFVNTLKPDTVTFTFFISPLFYHQSITDYKYT